MSIPMQSLIDSIFRMHHDYYRSIGVETIKQQAGQVEQVSADYQGRVLFELLQNAIDKARLAILVTVKDHCLYIANDGNPFTYQLHYNYMDGTSKRADFQSLCSISTSTKDANKNIGNKGVGFKSVFSIAGGGYVDIYTKGRIIGSMDSYEDVPVSFRVYDSFKDADHLPESLPQNLREELPGKIKRINTELKGRGVPGFYYPILLYEQDEYVKELFIKGFVTIVKIPFETSTTTEIKALFKEIKAIHFQFVQLRITNRTDIQFNFEGSPDLQFSKQINDNKTGFTVIHCPLREEVKPLAQAAGIHIDQPTVALYLRKVVSGRMSEGLLYNFLPTKVYSPLAGADFHADFHTTVDRKGINWEGKIGAYNSLLIKGCLELYFSYLNSYLPKEERVLLNLKYINQLEVGLSDINLFDWNYLSIIIIHPKVHAAVRRILRISDKYYNTASALIGQLAKQYFKHPRTKEQYRLFYIKSMSFIETMSRSTRRSHEWPKIFKDQLAKKLIEIDARIIYDEQGVSYSLKEELIFRDQKKDETKIALPSFVGVNIISWEIGDPDFKKALHIKDFTDRNEILKHYRQVSPTGKYHEDDPLSELEQIELLKSVYVLMGRADNNLVCTHRYAGFVNSKENTTANLANFAISTLFLKTVTGMYKPAQLCTYTELEPLFLDSLGMEDPDLFLKYLGVSHSKYRFVDNGLAQNTWLLEGLDFIPRLRERGIHEDQLRHSTVIEEIRILTGQESIHPAVVNDNGFAFLKDMRINDFKEEGVPLLVKEYGKFSREYLTIVVRACMESLVHRKDQCVRFYQQIFEPLHKHHAIYLISRRGILSFVHHIDFFIVRSEADFNLAESLDINVLCYHRSALDKLEFKQWRRLNFDETEVRYTDGIDRTEEFKGRLFDKLFYLLIEMTKSSDSEMDYFERPERIGALSRSLSEFGYIEVDSLQREIRCSATPMTILVDREYDYYENKLYILQSASSNVQAQAIAKHVFNNRRMAKTIELILFHKSDDVLRKEYQQDITLWLSVYNRHWILNYHERFTTFSHSLLNQFNGLSHTADVSWYKFTRGHKSEFILQVFRNNQLAALQVAIRNEKGLYENGMFDDFQLEIDYEMYNDQLAKLELHLQKSPIQVQNIFRDRLQNLKGKIGIDNELVYLENEIKEACKEAFEAPISKAAIDSTARIISMDNKVERIYQTMNAKVNSEMVDTMTEKSTGIADNIGPFPGSNTDTSHVSFYPAKPVNIFEPAAGSVTTSPVPVNVKKVIYQGDGTHMTFNNCEMIGATGEEEVLAYFIREFLQNKEVSMRKKAIEEVNALILSKLRENQETVDKHERFYKICMECIDSGDDQRLSKALIPFYYLTMHYKFSIIDMIVWHNNKAYLVEVKTSKIVGNKGFAISTGEVNEAMAHENYLIVRVTPREIIFMGNPLYAMRERLVNVEGDNFRIRANGYTFEFKE